MYIRVLGHRFVILYSNVDPTYVCTGFLLTRFETIQEKNSRPVLNFKQMVPDIAEKQRIDVHVLRFTIIRLL
jgi:hypothetical protein